VVIDEDTARAGAGIQPERSWTGSASFSQLLYSERAWSGYATEKHLQDARVEGRESVRLDIVRAAATAYLNVLRSKTIERIQKNNLRLTRSNLERASVRVSVGIAAPDEIYRWESEIANQRQAVLEAESRTMTSMNELNRILDRPIQEEFMPTEIDADDPIIVLSDKMYYAIVSNPKYRKSFRTFMIKEGLSLSPELKLIEAELAAQERVLSATRRDFWVPEFALKGGATELLAEDGEGLRDGSVLDIDNTEWFVGVFATFPLFTSGQKTASYRRAQEEVERLKIERDATVNRIEERVLVAINLTRSSYPSIDLSRDSAEAADKNLNLITDSYERGIKSIIDLIDAQNLALVADLNSANSIYDFLIDLVTVQRAVGRYGFFMDDEERQDWRRRFEVFAEEASMQQDQ
jgi:outer membrane protein TolC